MKCTYTIVEDLIYDLQKTWWGSEYAPSPHTQILNEVKYSV